MQGFLCTEGFQFSLIQILSSVYNLHPCIKLHNTGLFKVPNNFFLNWEAFQKGRKEGKKKREKKKKGEIKRGEKEKWKEERYKGKNRGMVGIKREMKSKKR